VEISFGMDFKLVEKKSFKIVDHGEDGGEGKDSTLFFEL
jgi:hypothetical protein